MEDEQIIGLYFERSESAISETDHKYGKPCRRLTYNVTGNHEDSEECVNDTYMKMWNAIPPKRPPDLPAFIFRIARNIAINLVRRRSTDKRGGGYHGVDYDEIAECLPDRMTVEKQTDDDTAVKAIEKFIASLPREKQIIFLKRYWYFGSVSDIADEMGMSESKIKMTLLRTREKLRQELEKEGINI